MNNLREEFPSEQTDASTLVAPNPALTHRLREYLLQPGAPNARLYPVWLAKRLDIDERELLGALAYGVRDGLVEMHWEVHCPFCSLSPAKFESLKEAHSRIECVACESDFDLHLDRDVRVTFSATERMRRERGVEMIPMRRSTRVAVLWLITRLSSRGCRKT